MKSDDKIMLKLIKLFLLYNPGSTAKDIAAFFSKHDFGLQRDYAPREISSIIRNCNSMPSNAYVWLGIEIASNSPKKYMVKE